jgi:hypothetical protein
MGQISLNDLYYSIEAEKKSEEDDSSLNSHQKEVKDKKPKLNIVDKVKEAGSKADMISKNFKLWARKSKNLIFYRKYLDRVQSGLYARYASTAKVEENAMVDDPVKILSGPAKEYIKQLVTNINELYHNVLDIANKLETNVTAEDAISCVSEFCKIPLDQTKTGSKVNDQKQSWKDKIITATKYKIAEILLSNRETGIYGYTKKNMVLKGFPKPNHLIVTLFVENPEENPTEQSVNEIFTSADSFDIIADADKRDIFDVSKMTSAALNKTIDNNVMNEIKKHKNAALQKFKEADISNKKDEGKIIDSIWNGVDEACKELLRKKSYLIDCINIYYEMILRIDKLAVKSIKEMLEVESANRDKRYKSQNLSYYKQNMKKNKYSDQYQDPSEKRQKYLDIANTAKKLNQH